MEFARHRAYPLLLRAGAAIPDDPPGFWTHPDRGIADTCRGLPTRAGGRRTAALTSTSSPCCSRRSRRLVKGAAARSAAGLLFMACRPSLSGASWSTGRTRATRCLRAISSCELPTDLVRKNSTSRKFHKSPYQGRKVAPTRTAPRPRRRRRRGGPPRNRRRPGGRPRGRARRSPRRVLA